MGARIGLAGLIVAVGFLVWAGQSGPQRSPAAAAVAVAAPDNETAFRILLGLTDRESTRWDGSVSASGGSVSGLEPWRFDENDAFDGESAWKLATHQPRIFQAMRQPNRPVVANGVIARFRDLASDAEIRVQTAQGNFSFRVSEVPYGTARKFLDGRAMVDRVPATVQVTSDQNDSDHQDYPAAATDREGNVWVAYVQFTMNPKFRGPRNALPQSEPMRNFAELAEPAGGDQVMLVRYSKGSWSEPIAVSEPKGDLYKPAVAVDGTGRVWVFWTANNNGNFDLHARAVERGTPGRSVRLSTDAGADITPAAATDSKGSVWVAWQAFRNGRGQIHASRQQGNAFTAAMVVSASAGNEWNPAIASSRKGEVTIAWDSYRHGDYDVFLRTYDASGKAGAERAVAATARYEAYPTLSYDNAGRLWAAWEESEPGWGKDYGAYETTGIGLYQGRVLRARVFEGDRSFAAGNLDAALPGVPRPQIDSTTRQADAPAGTQPDPQLAANRRPSGTPPPHPRPLNSYPRLLADGGGRVWLAFRTAHPNWFGALGTVWFENVVSFDGESWTNPIFLPHSDNLLDNRPALASTAAGELLVVNSSDGRQHASAPMRARARRAAKAQPPADYDNDLFASRIVLSEPVKQAKLDAAAPEAVPARPVAGHETPHSKSQRAYRMRLNGGEYRLVRGEFHRHTEMSGDGGRDGSLWDAWRYAIDAAAMDWLGCCDHDNGGGREYTWWTQQKLTDMFHMPGFTPMFSYERSVPYPEGHRNVVFVQRGIRTLPRLPRVDENSTGGAPDTRMLYEYLKHFSGIVASHTSATNMGTDWRDNDPEAEPIVEIYQGDRQNYEMPGAPRSNNEQDSIGGWRPKGFVSLALDMGYVMGFQASSDHISTHMSYAILYVTAPTRQALMDAFKKRHIYAATDDILADVRDATGKYMMGDRYETNEPPGFRVKLGGTAPFARVHIIRDGKHVYTTEPKTAAVDFTWRDASPQAGKTSYYYVRGEQADGEIVWVSPMWVTYRGK